MDRMDLSNKPDEHLWRFLGARLKPDNDWTPFLYGDQASRIRSLLATHLNSVSTELSARAAEMDALQQECLSQGWKGKDRWFEAQGKYGEWRSKAIRFKRVIETRLSEAKRAEVQARRERHEADEAARKEDLRGTVRVLTLAIAAHQDACRDADVEPTPADMALWEMLDTVRIPFGAGTATLAELLNGDRWS